MADENTITFKSESIKTFTERNFQPIIPTFCTILDQQELQPLDSLEGKSISKLFAGIELPFMKGFFKPYKMEKCEKITLSNAIMMDKVLACAVTAIPEDDYEFPIPVLEWSETEKVISVLVDFLPLADLIMRPDYRGKYLDPLEEHWVKYIKLPGMEPNRFAWTRQAMSPYSLCGHISKETEENKQLCIDIFTNYLETWMNICRNAEPIKDPAIKEQIRERKTKIRHLFRDNDEGAKTMRQMVDIEIIDGILLCNF
jgi:hypothetical protein